jgi:PAS domain S-box-containing protein
MTKENEISIELPDTKRSDFKVLETSDQKSSLYHPLRREILKALGQGLEGFETEVKKSERTLDDGTIVIEEVTMRKPLRRFWLNVKEILQLIKENDPKLKVSVFNCYYHLRKLQEQGLVEQYPPAVEEDVGDSKRVRGMYFRSAAQFFVPTTFEISTELAERDVLPPEVTEKAVQLAHQVKESGIPGAYEYSLRIGRANYWFAVTMSLHDDGESIISVVRDITDQRNAQEALRKSQERLDLALKGADLAPWDWHHDTGEMIFSESYAKMLGYPLEEMIQKRSKWESFVHPDDMDMVLQLWDEHLEGKTQTYSCQYRMRTKHKTFVWVLDRGRVVEWDEDGNPLRSAGTIQDVSADKIMMEALDRSEERYRRLVTESLQGIAIIVHERIVFANPAYAETVGRSVRDLLQLSADEVWSMIHPDDVPELKKRSKKLERDGVSLPRHRFRYIRPTGEVRWVESFVNVVEHDGESAIQTFEIDITDQQAAEAALRESEEKYRILIETSSFPYIIIQGDPLVIVYSNPAASLVSGYSSEELQSMGSDWLTRLIDERSLAGSVETLTDILSGALEANRQGYEDRYLHKDGTVLWLRAHPTKTTYNGKPALQVLFIDQTEQKTMELALGESEDEYRTLLKESEKPILLLKKGQVLDCSKAALKLFGCKKKEMLGKPIWLLSTRTQSDKTGSKKKAQGYLEEVMRQGTQLHRWRFKKCDGSSFEAETTWRRIEFTDESIIQIGLRPIRKK